MQVIPIKALPSQAVQVQLAGQATALNIYQLAYGLFVDVYVNNALVIGGVICQNLNRIVRDEYLGFVGDLTFLDTEGEDDPIYTGLGDRFQLIYLAEEDLVAPLLAPIPG